jgi:hypothetical protein
MRVLGTPEKPNPPTRTVAGPFMFLIASAAELARLSMARLEVEAEKFRRQTGRNTDTAGKDRDMMVSTSLERSLGNVLSEPAEREEKRREGDHDRES